MYAFGTDHHRTMYLKKAEQQFGRSFLEVFPFSEELGAVRDNRGAYFIDYEGKPVSQKRYRRAYPYKDGIAAVEDELGMFHIDHEGNGLYRERYAWVSDFSEGLCAARNLNGTYTFVDRNGKSWDMGFRWCSDFMDGTAVVLDKEGFAFVNNEGELLFSEHYDDCKKFDHGKAPVKKNGKWHLIDSQGQTVTEEFDLINEGRNGLITAVRNGILGYFTKSLDWKPLFTLQKEVVHNEIPSWTDDILKWDWDSCIVFIRHSERRSHCLCNDKGIGGTGLTPHGDELARAIGRKLIPLNDKKVSGYCSVSKRCVTTANCIMGAMGVRSDIGISDEVGPLGTAYIYDNNYTDEDLIRPSILSLNAQLKGDLLKGWYTNERIAQNLNDMFMRLTEEKNSLTFCVNHDIFVIPPIAYVTGRFAQNQWIDYCEGILIVRRGDSLFLIWNGKEYPFPPEGEIHIDNSLLPADIDMDLERPSDVKGWQWAPPEDIAWSSGCINGMYTLCDRKGRFFHARTDEYMTYNRTFSYAGDFSEQCAPIYTEGKGASFITDFGDYLNNRWFLACKEFSEGLAPVLCNDGWHYADVDGKIAISESFDEANVFHHGEALVFRNGVPCLLKRDGAVSGL